MKVRLLFLAVLVGACSSTPQVDPGDLDGGAASEGGLLPGEGGLVGDGGVPPATGCDESTRLVHVVTEERGFYRFKPDTATLELVGFLTCEKSGAMPTSMAIDRAGTWYTFTRITLPLVAPILMIAVIFRTMEAFKTFDLAYILTSQPTTEVISIRLYKMAFQEWQTGMSCALAYIVLIMVLAITNIYVKYLNKVKER